MLERVGKALAAGVESDAQLDVLDALLTHCDDVQSTAADQLTSLLRSSPVSHPSTLTVRGRTKTLTTLREKLIRMGGHQLPVVRDLAGLRIVGELTLDEQDRVLRGALAGLGVPTADFKVIDRRRSPTRGYRALHAEFPLRGVRVELQVRTALQHTWAEIYERAADGFGRTIRYEGPDLVGPGVSEFVDLMQQLSSAIERREHVKNMPFGDDVEDRPPMADDLRDTLRRLDALLDRQLPDQGEMR